MPLGTYACSFVPDFAGADDWKAWAPPKAKASNTEVFIAAETLESLLKEANLSFATIHTRQRCAISATARPHVSGRSNNVLAMVRH